MKKPEIKIEIVSDVVCPWCYIGKRRMEKAVSQLSSQIDFKITFSPFELNPNIPSEGINQKDYLSKKFGGEERYQKITQHVTQVAAGEGLQFDFLIQDVSPNTRDAHRVIWLAGKEGKQPEVKEAFMKAYFEEGMNLSKKEVLVSIAETAGLPKEKVEKLLASDEGLAEVESAEASHHLRGITGVPFYVINDKYAVSGAQATEVFEKVFTEIATKSAEEVNQ